MVMKAEKFVDVDGIKTCYFEKGEGDPLVLFHGGNFGSHDAADCALDWGLNFDGLARWFHVYAVDKLGQGYTDNPKSDDDYTMGAVVRHAYGFLQTMGLQDVHLMGHSRGGYLVARLTLEQPELIKSLIIVDSGTLSPGPSKTPMVMANAPEPRLSKESQRWVFERYSYGTGHITEEWLDAVSRIAMLPKYQETVKKMEAMGLKRSRFLPQLAIEKEETLGWIQEGRLRIPTLLVWGYNDPTARIQRGQMLFELVASSAPRVQMHVLNQAGHFSYREHPEAFNEVIRGFVQSG
ncbi:MAG: alpha/beta fold hydrolase [Candidatus Binatia bacterium]